MIRLRRAPPFIQYVSNPPPVTPGAMNMGYESEMLAWRPAIGPAIGASFMFRMFAVQNYQSVSMAALTGLGGVAQGQSALQPLSNPWQGNQTP